MAALEVGAAKHLWREEASSSSPSSSLTDVVRGTRAGGRSGGGRHCLPYAVTNKPINPDTKLPHFQLLHYEIGAE